MAITLTQDDVRELAPSTSTLQDGDGLLRKKAFSGLGRTADGAYLFANCQGSAADPYELFVDLSGAKPRLKCSCPSRVSPCKHLMGLLLEWVRSPSSFAQQATPAWVRGPAPATEDSPAKPRTRAPAKKKSEGEGEGEAAAVTEGAAAEGASVDSAAATSAVKKPKAADKKKAEAEKKKVGGQLEALETLEQFLLDLVASGLGGVTGRTVDAVEEQARRTNDAKLPGAHMLLMNLASLACRGASQGGKSASAMLGAPMSNEERLARMAGLATQLWVMIRKGKRTLEGKLEEGESQSEADAALESILGTPWRLTQLQERGYWTKDRQYVELAHERSTDDVMDMVEARGHLLDLGDGTVVQELTRLPKNVYETQGDKAKLRPSRAGVLVVKEAALYPGAVLNRRVRWDDKIDTTHEVTVENQRFPQVHEHAQTLDVALKAFREQLKNLLAPGSGNLPALPNAVVLVRAARFGVAEGDVLVLEDPSGARLAIRDPAEAPYATTENLRHAAGAYASGSLAVRLWFHPVERVIYGQALTLFTDDGQRLRLGL